MFDIRYIYVARFRVLVRRKTVIRWRSTWKRCRKTQILIHQQTRSDADFFLFYKLLFFLAIRFIDDWLKTTGDRPKCLFHRNDIAVSVVHSIFSVIRNRSRARKKKCVKNTVFSRDRKSFARTRRRKRVWQKNVSKITCSSDTSKTPRGRQTHSRNDDTGRSGFSGRTHQTRGVHSARDSRRFAFFPRFRTRVRKRDVVVLTG